jgi:UTP--glucose-1-phosphate uridylyltransferase
MGTRVHKGVIVAAGYGTRFLPATKTLPKEMLPLMDRPAIQFIVDEFRDAGIDEILVITSRRKKTLEDYFDREVELEAVLAGDEAKLARLQLADFDNVKFSFVRQKRMLGTLSALFLAREFAAGEPLAIAYPDDVFFSKTPVTRQLIDALCTYESEKPVVCAIAVEDFGERDVSRYGVVVPKPGADTTQRVFEIAGVVEKPCTPPSHCVSYGRYVFTSALFPDIERQFKKHGFDGTKELTLSPASDDLAREGAALAVCVEGVRRDLGQPEGFLAAGIDYALSGGLEGDELRDFKQYLKSLADGL